MILKLMFLYFCLISVVAIAMTVYDKKASRHKKWRRISEKYLLFVGVLGGSLAMYITMKKIHHKTHHKRFMKGLPAMLTAQFLIVMAALFVLV